MIACGGPLKTAICEWRFVLKAPRRKSKTRWMSAAHPALRFATVAQAQLFF